MKPTKEDIAFVQKLKDEGRIARHDVADMLYGISICELEQVKKRRNGRIAAIAEVYKE